MKKSFSSFMSFVLLMTLAIPLVGATPTSAQASKHVGVKTDTTLKKSATGLYIIQLEDAPLATYHGGIQGLQATSPRVAGGNTVNITSSASQAYLNYLGSKRLTAMRAIEQTLGGRPDVVQVYDTAFNGMALRMTQTQAQQIQSLPGVQRVFPDTLAQLQTDTGPGFIGAAQVGASHAPALFKATLNGQQETPPTTSTGTGSGVFTYDETSKVLTFQIRYSGLSGPATAAHIHSGAAGVAGPVLYPLTVIAPGAIVGTVTLNNANQALLYAGSLYVNIHTAANPGGEIRSQILPNQGEGVIVGVLDTGINFTHKSFAATGKDGYTVTNPFGNGKYKGACDPTNLPSAADGNPSGYNPAITCNSKLIGAWTFSATAPTTSPIGEPSPADDDGHGSHTASTAAGNIVDSQIIIPSVVTGTETVTDTGTVGGVAPHANIIAYDVCGTATSSGCPTSASVAAVDHAIKDGVNVINFSIGGNSDDPWGSADAIAFLSALDAGVLVSVSAGNDGPAASTIGSPSNAPWVMSAGASTHNRVYRNNLTGFTGGSNPPSPLVGKGFSNGTSGALPVVYAGDAPYSNPLCAPFGSGVSLAGLIVVCDRGTYGRVEKAENVAKAGGAGYVLANDAANGASLNGDVYPIPGVHISYDNGLKLKTWLATSGSHSARITGAYKDLSASNGDIMASFSSRGPDATALDILKPDITAPGVDILAAYVNESASRDEFAFESGTSMASPHNAGAMALLRQAHPDWTPSEVFSALMTTAITSTLRKEDGTTKADPFDYGAGRIDVSRAVLAGMVLDETADNYSNADPLAGGEPRTLNRASMEDSKCVVSCTWTRTFRSTMPVTTTWNATTAVSGSLGLSVTPSSFTVAPGATQIVTITADVSSIALDTYTFGSVMLTDADGRAPMAHLPVAVQSAASTLQQELQIESNQAQGSTTIAGIRAIAISNLAVNVYGLTKAHYTNASVSQDSDNTSPFDDLSDGVSIQAVDVPTNTARFVTEVITTTAEDLDMYVAVDGIDGSTPDGVPQVSELVCISATGSALEKCDIPFPDAGHYFIMINNWQSSAAGVDNFTLSTGVVPAQSAGNMTVSAPSTRPANQPFDVTVSWNVPRTVGDHWYGAFDLGTDPSNAANLGYTTVDLVSSATPTINYLPIISK